MTTITKSIRLSPAESSALADLSAKMSLSETALMKKWILEGMQAQKLDLAIQAYSQRKIDLRGGAKLAGVSYNRFIREIQERNIVVLEDTGFAQRLAELGEMLAEPSLTSAALAIAELSEE